VLCAAALIGFGCDSDDDNGRRSVLDGRTYVEMYECSQTFTGGDPSAPTTT